MKTDKSQDKYDEIFQELREEKMKWDFNDFLAEAEKKQAQSIKIPKKKSASPQKFYWLAASLVLLVSLGAYIRFSNFGTINEQDLLVQDQILKQKDAFNTENGFAMQKTDSIKTTDSAHIPSVLNDEAVMDKILPKRGRLKKQIRPQFAKNATDEISAAKKSAMLPDYESNYVIINGQRIENEQEAIDVAKYSLQMLSENVSKTVAHTDVLPTFTD